jgi:hypothetical protein
MRNFTEAYLSGLYLSCSFHGRGGKANADPLVLTITNPSQSVLPRRKHHFPNCSIKV